MTIHPIGEGIARRRRLLLCSRCNGCLLNKLSPVLINGGALPTVFKIKGKLGGCTTDAPRVTLLNGKSTITLDNGDATAGLFATGWGAPYGYFGLGVNPRPSGTARNPVAVSGAFTGGSGGINSTADIVTGEDTALILGQCGGLGVKAITIAIGQLQLS